MGTHLTKIQGKWKHKYTQPKEKKTNNQQNPGKNPMHSKLMVTKWQSI
jgi:hypothetical protein